MDLCENKWVVSSPVELPTPSESASDGVEPIRAGVWAPAAKETALWIGDRRYPLFYRSDGWWVEKTPHLVPGCHYWFEVDGAKYPDPRSPSQPKGVHGPSQYIGHNSFRWSDDNWQARPISASVFYELHVGTFSEEGTFDGAITHLDHLVRLGVSHVELMPINEFLGKHGWGYDGVFPFAPHHTYGGPDGLKRFVDACHAKGLAVILDLVFNHLGPSGNYLPKFAPYFTSRYQTPWGDGVNFDGKQSDEVRRYFCDSALMWLRDYHVDGLRLDAVHAINDRTAVHFLEQLATEVGELKAALGRHLVLIAESDLNDPRIIQPWEIGGFGLDAQWTDDVHHALHGVLTGERSGYYADFGSLKDLATAMVRPFVYDGRHSVHRQRRHGRPPQNVSAHRFIAYLQNHDQLGNRAKGERLCHLASPGRVKIGAALILLGPYIPLLFQGEEWGASSPFLFFVDFASEPSLAQAVVEGRQKEFSSFGWSAENIPDPNSLATFERSKLDWKELSIPEHAEMLEWYHQLILVRHRVSSLTSGRLDMVETVFDENEEWLVVKRGSVYTFCNFSAEPRRLLCGVPENWAVLVGSKALLSRDATGTELAPESVVIVAAETARFHSSVAAIVPRTPI
jgi:maltooligosyltrehalose trehalohydrolase